MSPVYALVISVRPARPTLEIRWNEDVHVTFSGETLRSTTTEQGSALPLHPGLATRGLAPVRIVLFSQRLTAQRLTTRSFS